MKETIQVGTAVWRNMHGTVILELSDFTPDLSKAHDFVTLGQWKKTFNGTKAQLRHPFGGVSFSYEFSHWSHLPDETYLQLQWKFIPARPSSGIKPTAAK